MRHGRADVLAGGCQRNGDQMPYAPLLEALQSYLGAQNTARLRTDLRGLRLAGAAPTGIGRRAD